MRIHVEQISESSRPLAFEAPAERFPILKEMVRTGEYEFTEAIHVRLRAARVGEMVEVEGSMRTAVRIACARCLTPFICPLALDFALTYTGELSEADGGSQSEGREIEASEAGLIYFQGEEIDLTEGVQEQVILSLPLRPLCRTDCRGLCARCGVDLNQERCRCAPSSAESPFAALGRLNLNPKSGGSHGR